MFDQTPETQRIGPKPPGTLAHTDPRPKRRTFSLMATPGGARLWVGQCRSASNSLVARPQRDSELSEVATTRACLWAPSVLFVGHFGSLTQGHFWTGCGGSGPSAKFPVRISRALREMLTGLLASPREMGLVPFGRLGTPVVALKGDQQEHHQLGSPFVAPTHI